VVGSSVLARPLGPPALPTSMVVISLRVGQDVLYAPQLGAKTHEIGVLIDPAFFSRSGFSISSTALKPTTRRSSSRESYELLHNSVSSLGKKATNASLVLDVTSNIAQNVTPVIALASHCA
jgi:hypothetical protein